MAVKDDVSPTQEQRLQEVLAAYLRELEAGRQPNQAEILARHPDLAGELQDFFSAHQKLGRLAEPLRQAVQPNAEPQQTTDPNGETAGTLIAGRYKLLESIGHGGMGQVWMAEQRIPVKRLVALKLIKAGMDSRAVLTRFEAERQALALMDHANIARVFDGGSTAAGRPYIVMELVKGLPLTTYCDQRRLSVPQRLELFVQVCSAVQHAHQKGIMHRDLKPSNILVTEYDGRAVPKVIDFGLAKALTTTSVLTEHTLHTAFGTMVGTPLYMAPEQVGINALDVDTRTDIYALGVLLYELLTGTTPLERKRMKEAAWEEVRRLIREEEPPRPSLRLSSSDALSNLAVQRGTEPTKLPKLVRGELDWIVMKALEKDRSRRYETANGFARDIQRYLADEPVQACPPSTLYRLRKIVRRHKAGLGVATCLLVVLGVCAWLLWRDVGRRADAETAVQAALERADVLRQEQRWQEASAVLAVAQGQLGGHGLEALRQRLEQARQDLDMLMKLEEARLQRSATTATVQAQSTERSFDYAGADRLYTEAFQRYGIDVAALEPEEAARRVRASVIRDHLTEGLDDWAISREQNSDAASGKRLRSIARLADEDPWRQKLRDAVERADRAGLEALAEQEDTLSKCPSSLALLGRILRNAGSGVIAERLLRRAQAVHPADFWLNYELAVTLTTKKVPEWGQAVRFLQAALALRPQSASVCTTLGFALVGEEKFAEAEAAFRKAIALKPDDAIAHHDVGFALDRQGKHVEAEGAFRKAIALKPDFKLGYLNIASQLSKQGKHAEADAEVEAAYRKSIALKPDDAGTHHALGDFLALKGKFAEAEAAYRKSIALKPDDAGTHHALGDFLALKGKFAEAEAAYRTSIALKPDDGWVQQEFGSLVLIQQGRWTEAEEFFRKAIALHCHDPAKAHRDLGDALYYQGKWAEAEAVWRKAIALKPDYAPPHKNLGILLAQQGKLVEAEAAFRKAIALKPVDAGLYFQLGNHLIRQGKLAEAEAAFRKAIALQPDFAKAHDGLRAVLHAQGKVAEREAADRAAEAVFRKAIARKQDDANAHNNLRAILRAQGKVAEQEAADRAAEAAFRNAIEFKPDDAAAHTNLGVALDEQGKHAEAEAAYRKAIALKPNYGWAYVHLGKHLVRQGKWEEAEAAFRKASTLHYNVPVDANINLGEVLVRQGKWAEAEAAYRKAIRYRFEDAEARSHLGHLLQSQGKLKDAVTCYRDAAGHRPDSAQFHRQLAWLLAICPDLKLRDPGQALEHAQKAVELAPGEAMSWKTLGAAQYRNGVWKEAIDALMKSVQLDKEGDGFDLFFLAMAHWHLNEKDKARTWYDRAVAWMEQHRPQDKELKPLRVEAATLLGLAKAAEE